MATITVWNKGKREWQLKNADGKIVKLNPQESIEMEEGEGRRYCMGYPRDLSTTGVAGPSQSDLARREQSLKDREKNLAEKEKALEEREAAVKAREAALGNPNNSGTPTPKRGRPVKPIDVIAAAEASGELINADKAQ